MKLSTITTALAIAISAGVAVAQLPEVKPQPVPKGDLAKELDDSTITSKVREAISSDPQLKDIEFTVETADSVVTINGTANARDQIARAIAIARAVPGVKSVVNIMAVRTS